MTAKILRDAAAKVRRESPDEIGDATGRLLDAIATRAELIGGSMANPVRARRLVYENLPGYREAVDLARAILRRGRGG